MSKEVDIELVKAGNFIKERYIKCPYPEKKCKWNMEVSHRKGYEYLDNACYLSGSFNLDCPE